MLQGHQEAGVIMYYRLCHCNLVHGDHHLLVTTFRSAEWVLIEQRIISTISPLIKKESRFGMEK